MKYALNLAEDNRILSAWKVLSSSDNEVAPGDEEFSDSDIEKVADGNYEGMPIVEELPEGDISEYRYVDGEFVHDPLPEPEQPEAGPTNEERIAALEEENAMLMECLLEMSEIVYA